MRRLLIVGIVAIAICLIACGNGSASTEQEGSSESTNAAETDVKGVELVESGYSIKEPDEIDSSMFVYYGFVIKNANEETAFKNPIVTATAFDENNNVIATENCYMRIIQPGETQGMAWSMDCHGVKPARVDFSIESGDELSEPRDTVRASDFEITGVNERIDEGGNCTTTGMIKNTSDKDCENVMIAVLYRANGEIVSATFDNWTVGELKSGQEKPFEVNEFYGNFAHDDFEVYAIDWIN